MLNGVVVTSMALSLILGGLVYGIRWSLIPIEIGGVLCGCSGGLAGVHQV